MEGQRGGPAGESEKAAHPTFDFADQIEPGAGSAEAPAAASRLERTSSTGAATETLAPELVPGQFVIVAGDDNGEAWTYGGPAPGQPGMAIIHRPNRISPENPYNWVVDARLLRLAQAPSEKNDSAATDRFSGLADQL